MGVSFDPEKLEGLGDAVADMIENADRWSETIRAVRDETIYNVGGGREAAGEYLLEAILSHQRQRADKEAENDE